MKKYILSLFILVVLAVIIFLVSYLLQDRCLGSYANPDGTFGTVCDTNDKQNWQTFSDDVMGIRFEYPSDWFVENKFAGRSDDLAGVSNITNYPYPYPEPLPKDFIKIQIQLGTKLTSDSLEDIASRPDEISNGTQKIELIKIGGVDVIKSNKAGSGVYYIPKSDKEYFVVMVFSNQQSKLITDRIISSFKIGEVTENVGTKIRNEMSQVGCPDEMIVNKMPSVIDDRGVIPPPKAYYIKDGKRVEVADYDSVWVSANCEVPVLEVQ